VALVIDQDTQRSAVQQERPGRAADCLADQADDRPDHQRGPLPMDEIVTITQDDVDTEKGSRRACAWAPNSPVAN
jgi:hypothetical protein